MARRCYYCNRGTQTGNQVSHSNRKTRRKWYPNLQRMRILVDGQPRRQYVCTRCLRSGRVLRAL
ncbi:MULTISPECIES: 50S ribosomal protein L28 [Limnochorda]|uniref:50S ribosomal protein L28 n=1 Tax=Limnochorda TaxID=1676651 RepID=UPI001D88C002|nr:50S ribosomal protein L28 [Limnochorda pilosa]MBO2486861.1 50S ribosomal protein L28 [Bacillota bacterium]MBO2519435.1 50S ribosomal protein L28 [Bacillota bacterium]